MQVPLSTLMPSGFFPEPLRSIIDDVEIQDYRIKAVTGGVEISFNVLPSSGPIEISVSGDNGLIVVIDQLAEINIQLADELRFEARFDHLTVRLPEFLRPAILENGQWVRDETERQTIRFASTHGGIGAFWDSDLGFGLDWPTDSAGVIDIPSVTVGDTMIGSSGVVFSATDLDLILQGSNVAVTAARADIHLPDDFPTAPDLAFEDVRIDAFGFTGSAAADWGDLIFDSTTATFAGRAAGKLFGLSGGLERFALEFRDNVVVASDIRGGLCVPYFNEPVTVQISLSLNGDFNVTLSSTDGETQLRKEELIQLSLKSLTVQKEGALGTVKITGGLEPLLMASDGLQWPRLDVTDLSIDSTGKFSIKEAWLDLKELATLDLWGFHFELRRIGIGYEDASDKLWIDLSGGLRLIEQIPVALDVEGFRLKWPRTLLDGVSGPLTLAEIQDVASQLEVVFEGIYLFFGVPDAVEFEGLIRFFKQAQLVGFAGDMALRIPASGFGAEAGLLIGLSFDPPFPFLYVYFGVELPAGIPLGQSGLALKGALGMFGLNVAPDKTPEQNWYYDWYKRGPIVGAHPTNKWKPQQNALALGVGVTITTADGYVKGTRGLIVLSIPGPVLIIEGRALILSGLEPDAEPPLRALAVFDGSAGTVQFNVEAEATLIADLLKAYGMLEAFFDFNDLTNWHLYLGQDTPRDRRIRADILKLENKFLFKADAYLMIDMVGADTLRSRMGVSIGFEPEIPKIDPLKVEFSGTLEGDGIVTARPEQFSGEVDLSANIKLSTLGMSVRVSADADFLTEGPKPLKAGAHVKIEADLPAPLDPLQTTVEFEWQAPDLPRVESPLAEIDVHSRLAPRGAGFSENATAAENRINDLTSIGTRWESSARHSPIVEVDARPIICFKQKMNSDVQSFARHPSGETHHYDVGLFYFIPTLTTIRLYEHLKEGGDAWSGEDKDWTLIASTDPGDSKHLSGVWLVNSDPDSPQAPAPRQVQLWTDNPLASSARAMGSGYRQFLGAVGPGKSLAERILDDYPELMKCEYTKAQQVCVDFESAGTLSIEPGDVWEYKDLLVHPTVRSAGVRRTGGGTPSATPPIGLAANIGEILRRGSSWLVGTILGRGSRACLFIEGYADIQFRQRVKKVRLTFCQPSKLSETEIRVRVSTKRGIRSTSDFDASTIRNSPAITLAEIRGCNVNVRSDLTVSQGEWILEADEGFDCLHIVRMDEFAISEICYTTVTEVDRARHALEQCKNNGNLPDGGIRLRPGAYYRLDVMTEVRGELNLEDLPFDEESPIGKMLTEAYEALGDALANEVPLPRSYHQTCFFQTESPPTNLDPYVKWCSPPHQFERFFYGETIAIRFLRSSLHDMFKSSFAIKAQVKDTQGNLVQDCVTEWSHARSSTLFIEESIWEAHRSSLDWPDRATAPDDMLLVSFANESEGLSPLARYRLEIVGSSGDAEWNKSVLFSSDFTTSRFRGFEDLVRSYSRPKIIKAKTVSPAPGIIAALQLSSRRVARARWQWEHAEIDFRFEVLAGGRKGLEDARLFKRETAAAHEEKFRALADSLADAYFLPVSEKLELLLVRDPGTKNILALWIRSPESLDVRLDVKESPDRPDSAIMDQVGRTEIDLTKTGTPGGSIGVMVLPNADSSQLIILPSSRQPWQRGTYSLNLTYHRDYGDEMKQIDHRYDRAVEFKGHDSTPVVSSLGFVI